MKKQFLILVSFIAFSALAQNIKWPEVKTEAKPAARWWWMGSAVDKENLTRNLEAYAAAGMGTMEVTPIYGVQGNESNDIPFLSPGWMRMLRHTESEASRLGMQIDMNTGTGWPFGGPEVAIEDAACKLFVREYQVKGGERFCSKIKVADAKQLPYARLERLMAFNIDADAPSTKEQKQRRRCIDLTSKVENGVLDWKAPKGNWRLIAAFCGKTLQKVKRAAPGGEGYVMNHFSARAVKTILGVLNTHSLLPPILIISSMILTRYIRPIGPKACSMSSWHGGDINWKTTCRNSLLRVNVRTLPAASFPTIGKLLANCFSRTLHAGGPSGLIFTAQKHVTRLMAPPET